ncbi:MAG: hypothetical protein ABIO44_00190, partial [Saprospiraceae bacterium]
MDLLKSITQGELASLLWLKQAHIVSNYKGFAHSRIMYLPSFLAWRAPYPETSGYIIENFLVFNKGIVDDGMQIALDSAYWLLDIQSDKNYYYSGLKKLKPSSFNTAQIIFGLKEAFNFTSDVRFKNAYINAKDWILSGIDDSGKWTNGLYKENYFASYYSRAIWPLLLVSDSQDKIILEKSLNHLWQKSNEYYSFTDLGFELNKSILTHTIAYALEGFLESSIILRNNSMTNRCLEILKFVAHLIQQEKALHGIYNDQWKHLSNMKCV